MSAEIATGRFVERVPLHSVVPLVVPFTVAISPSELCNFRCVYCDWGTPEGVLGATVLKWENFIKIAGQVKALYKKADMKCKNLRLYGQGEPLLNPRIVDMVQYLHDLDFSERIEITTNASLLTPQLSKSLVNAGLTRLIVSIQGVSSEKYKAICGLDVGFDLIVDKVKCFHSAAAASACGCKLHVKTVNVALEPEEHRHFYEIFSPICDTMNIEDVIKISDTVDYDAMFLNLRPEITRYGTPVIVQRCCASLFYLMNIRPNGHVDACACTWPPIFIGDIFETPLEGIWNHGRHKNLMLAHLQGRGLTLDRCKECFSLTHYHMPEDNLDDHTEEILQRLLQQEGLTVK